MNSIRERVRVLSYKGWPYMALFCMYVALLVLIGVCKYIGNAYRVF